MDGDEVVGVLKEIRDEVRQVRDEVRQTNARLDQTNARLDQTNARLDQTNARLEQTNTRLESVDGRLHLVVGRFDFLERSVRKGFADVNETLRDHGEHIERLFGAHTALTEQLRDLITRRLDDHAIVLDDEKRIKTLESRE